jgi:hypothetical protein
MLRCCMSWERHLVIGSDASASDVEGKGCGLGYANGRTWIWCFGNGDRVVDMIVDVELFQCRTLHPSES